MASSGITQKISDKKTNTATKLLAWTLGLTFVGFSFVLLGQTNQAQAAINPEFTQTSAGRELQTGTFNSLESLTISSPSITTGTNVEASASGSSSQLKPPSGLDNPLPKTSGATARKKLPKQDKLVLRWIEVDLSRQRMWLWEGSRLVDTFLTSSGVPGFDTPTGTYTIWKRVRSEYMSDGSTYFLDNVEYTQYFTGLGHAIHGKWWNNIYGSPTSHGCLGLPNWRAAQVWNWAGVGTKVNIHY